MTTLTWVSNEGYVKTSTFSGNFTVKPALSFSFDSLYYESDTDNYFCVLAGVTTPLTTADLTSVSQYLSAFNTGILLSPGVDSSGAYLGIVERQNAAAVVPSAPPTVGNWQWNTASSSYVPVYGVDSSGNYLGSVPIHNCYANVGSAPPVTPGVPYIWSFTSSSWVDSRTQAQILQAAQNAQIASLSNSCKSTIYAGFNSSALGSAHQYPAKDTDQTNLSGSVLSGLMAKSNALPWAASVVVNAGETMIVAGEVLQATVGGTTGTTAPAVPAIGATVTDNTVTWEVWTTPFWCQDSSGNWSLAPHTSSQIQKAGTDGKQSILAAIQKNTTLAGQVMAVSGIAAWTASANNASGAEIQESGNIWKCTTPGASGTTAPVWPASPTTTTTVADGAAVWTFVSTQVAAVQAVVW